MDTEFSLKSTTPRASKTELVIGGVKAYIYGLEEAKQQKYSDVAVLYHVHGRTRNYLTSEGFAHEVLDRYRRDGAPKKAGLIAVAFDARNHGERMISVQANDGWGEGNETHAQDLVSMVSGSAQDVELLIDYLPAYLPEFQTFYNIMSGISLGGHTSWRLATSSIATKGKLHGLAIIVGCPNLSAMLLSRLGVDLDALGVSLDQVRTVPYSELSAKLNKSQRTRWPRALSELFAGFDRETDERFPRHIPTYILNGKLDSLVPDKFTQPWVAKRRAEGYENIDYFVQENAGHSCTDQMVENIAQWLARLFSRD
ncbi:hypothetical protein UA08_02483 [Talaromyces atroroseus]|uniref:AB hydrolase-1 domain-containing protein n=1 Tax=Talaromyces atroroseus TaxID=1441469 RepID=A0A225ALP5_TALAT|nr:hypothetical protein UA08_02483 [Talaromyces atroroseus]OKL61830.1 hypothetical protein UA08_02483 [Talaromyces atroroseus]